MSRPLILWGVHPAHGPLPLKIAEWSRAEQRRRESEGWTCAVYAQGDAPTGLALVTAVPLCLECMGAIGGACGGPDAPYRPAKPGEPCGAADHEDDRPDAYEVWNAGGTPDEVNNA